MALTAQAWTANPLSGPVSLAQMILWSLFWDLQRVAWSVFLVLFCVNTAPNLTGDFRRPEGGGVSRRG